MKTATFIALAAGLCAAPLLAQDTVEQPSSSGGKRTRIGVGPQVAPVYPGADRRSVFPMFEFSRANADEQFAFAAADDSFGPALIRTEGFSFGPSLALQGKRRLKDTDGLLPRVKRTFEAGAFAQIELDSFRLRGEARKGIGGHKGLIGNVSADFVARDGDNWLFAVGPRVRFVNAKYSRAYFGVTPAEAVPAIGLAAYDPDGGVGSIGAAANGIYSFTPNWGLLGYVRYDRLNSDAKRSPVVDLYGDRNQWSGGVALTYTFGR